MPPRPAPGDRSLGERVRAERTARGIPLRHLSAELGMSASTLSDFETGKSVPRPARVGALCERLGIEPPSTEPTLFTHWRAYAPVEIPRAHAAALEVFTESGYHGSTMRTIAERAGISVAGLYHHAAGKHDLLTWLLERTMVELIARCEAALGDSEDPDRQLRDLTECIVRFHAHRQAWALLAAMELRALQPAARARLWAQRARVRELVRLRVAAVRGVGAQDAAAGRAAVAIVTMAVAVADWYRPGGDDVEVIAGDYAALAAAMAALRPR